MAEYWLHRISHEWAVSYPLLRQGYLSVGWERATCREIIDARTEDDFNRLCAEKGISEYRSRWVIWNMAHYEVGDIIVIPLFDGMFGVYKVVEKTKPTSELEIKNLISDTGYEVFLNGSHFVYAVLNENGENQIVDIGFVCKVEPIVENVSRAKFADAALTSRMKLRQTNAKISGIFESVDNAINGALSNTPLNFYENVNNDLSSVLLKRIEYDLIPDKVEELVKLYFQRMGASYVDIPSKNQSGKKDGADADVIAEFEPLKVVFYVQVKKHSGTTSSWAVEQIRKYLDQMEDIGDDCTYIPWVISTADTFSDEAYEMVKKAAEEKHTFIRLINGKEFVKMLLDCGLGGYDKLTDK